jgi:apolipoprotein N-acyltransferase
LDNVGGGKAWRNDPDSNTAQSAVQSRWEAYFAETEREANAGAQLVIWNEIAGLTSNSIMASMITSAQDIAKGHNIYLAVPLAIFYPSDMEKPYENTLLLIDPSGAIVLEHDKFGGAIIEAGRLVGDGKLKAVNTPFGLLSAVICWDADYPAIIRQAGENNTGLMLVPSSDALPIDPVHTHMAVFRAIENGMSLVRQTESGLSMAVDPYGRVLAQTDFYGATDRTMVAQVPVNHVTTVYTLIGNYFEWVCLAGFLYLVARAVLTRRQTN